MRVGVTGGIAEGKSSVLGYLAEKGHTTWSADACVKSLWSDPTVRGEIASHFGTADRSRESWWEILESEQARRQLNRIFHPRVVADLRQSPAEFFEVPLLFETDLAPLFDEIWVVTCGPEAQRQRLIERGIREIDAVLRLQLPTRAKIPFAGHVIRTNRPFEDVHRQIDRALDR